MNNESVGTGINSIADIATNANNPAISMAAVLIIGLIVLMIVFISLYTIYNKGNKDRLEQYIKREDRILQAFEKNSETNSLVATAVVSLKTVLETNDKNCDTCRADQLIILRDIQDSQSDANMKLGVLLERRDVDIRYIESAQRISQEASDQRQAKPHRTVS